VVGDKEVESNVVSVRARGGEDLGQMTMDALIAKLNDQVETRT